MSECSVDGCPFPVRKGGYCDSHLKRQTRKRIGESSIPVSGLIERRPSGMERVCECALTYYEADSEDDDAYRRAFDNLRKAVAAGRSDAISGLVKEALARAKACGVRLGRPPKLVIETAVAVVRETGSVRAAAVRLCVSVETVRRVLRKARRAGDNKNPGL